MQRGLSEIGIHEKGLLAELRDGNSDIRGNKEITCRTQNALFVEGVYQLSVLTQWTERELRKIPNLGKKSIDELKFHLAARGLSLKNA